ncbi:hypothetical protein F7725_007276 [Dissostichus mawsoni]|uniref:Uncharacterized protein n=1 Tax=Dissostichus mawsoni TaxID=36200 RepID=A0A7J5XXB0_DISMA|nr:hypothetical protein F7725_007276 [Dissostichus mawsoni]
MIPGCYQPTQENERKKKDGRGTKKLEGRHRRAESIVSGELLSPLHARQLAPLHMNGRELLLHLNHQLDTINHQLHLGHLGGAQTVSVGDVEHTTHGGCVHTTWRG